MVVGRAITQLSPPPNVVIYGNIRKFLTLTTIILIKQTKKLPMVP